MIRFSSLLRSTTGPLSTKITTNITGLPAIANARDVLRGLLKQTLHEVKALPEDFIYRKNLESVCNFRLSVLERETDVEKIEAEIADGQIEELIEEHKEEFEAIEVLKEHKPYETDPDNVEIHMYVPEEEKSKLVDPERVAKWQPELFRRRRAKLEEGHANLDEWQMSYVNPHILTAENTPDPNYEVPAGYVAPVEDESEYPDWWRNAPTRRSRAAAVAAAAAAKSSASATSGGSPGSTEAPKPKP